MKNVLIKIGLIFLSIVLSTVIIVNGWMLFITYKLSESEHFIERATIICKYKVFQHAWIGAYSMILTVILLSLMLWFIIKEFLIKNRKTVYVLEEEKVK